MAFHCCLFDRECRRDMGLTRLCVVTVGRWSRTFRLPGARAFWARVEHSDGVTTWTSGSGYVTVASSARISNLTYAGVPMVRVAR